MPTHLIESALITSSIPQFQNVFLNLLTFLFILHSCHILFISPHMAASWALKDGKKQKTLLLLLHFTGRKSYLNEKFIRCVFWWAFQNFHEEKDGQGQQSRKISPEPVGPGDWEQQPENRSVKTQMKTRGPLGWYQLDTSSNWCIKKICLMFIWKRYLMFMWKRSILALLVVCSGTIALLE